MKNQILYDKIKNTHAIAQWEGIGFDPHHGFCIPLFSLRTKTSLGIGEFLDLLPLIDWCAKLSMDVIQLLPINDTGTEKSPYSAISSLALNPVYISLHVLEKCHDTPKLRKLYAELEEFEKLKRANYHDVRAKKLEYLYTYFSCPDIFKRHKEDYYNFFKKHAWVRDYALFRILKNHFDQKPWHNWPKTYQDPTNAKLEEWAKKFEKELKYEIFLQYLCFSQMERVKKYANEKKVFIKGDIPILVNKDSVDVWTQQDSFFREKFAGCPPDRFNREGQNWGFPLFNWKRMEENDYAWWKERLKVAQNIFNIYRVDHAVGFFRIWAVHKGKTPGFGNFEPEDKKKWLEHGSKVFRMMLLNTTMLPIAEDLGTVPKKIQECIKSLGICGTSVLHSQYHWRYPHFFKDAQNYHPVSMTTVGTHDMEPLAAWYKRYPQISKRFAHFMHWDYDGKMTRLQQEQTLTFAHSTSSAFHINMFDEYLSLIEEFTIEPLEDRRINLPGMIIKNNWTLRMNQPLETVSKHEQLNQTLCRILKNP
ncbi:MAG: 4-alpha-glucanotransferase [Chlamydiae bacterium]|nr:4-alpha-glucanotransferase [Chlamydiota bacterium]